MAIFVTGLTGGAKEEPKDIEMTLISGNSSAVFSNNDYYQIKANWNIRLNEKITDLTSMFQLQESLEGVIIFNCYPSTFSNCLASTSYTPKNLRIDYTSICTNIDNIIATGNTSYITKGYLVD